MIVDDADRRRYLDALGLRDWMRRDASSQQPAPSTLPRGAAQSRIPDSAASAVSKGKDAPATMTRMGAVASANGTPVSSSSAKPAVTPVPAPAEAPVSEPVPAEALRSLEAARNCVAECRRCRLHETRTQTVFGVGPDDAPLLVIGEGPGAEEDRRGEPFVGRAGQLLDAMLAAIGHNRHDNTYIANVVKCRPPNNRDPATDEVAACRGFLDAQIALLQPKLVLALGRVAAQRLLDTDTALSKLRGQLHHYGPSQVPVWISYHPAYLLRAPREKAKAWDDLKQVHTRLQQAVGDGTGA